MQRILLGAVLALAGVSVGYAQQPASGEVFQWTDANGVTHYSQTPPAKGKFQHRVINQAGSAAPVASEAEAATVAAAGNPQCTTARANIEALQGEAQVQQDTDGDGKPDKTLDAAERTSQLELAQAAVKAYCTP